MKNEEYMTQASIAPAVTMPPLAKSTDERKYLLAQRVAQMAGEGYRVESQSDFMAVMVSGRRVNHLLHFFIGIFTLGLWWIAWLIMALAGGERRQVVTVDEYGNLVVGRRTAG
jgi:hypothetical protein